MIIETWEQNTDALLVGFWHKKWKKADKLKPDRTTPLSANVSRAAAHFL